MKKQPQRKLRGTWVAPVIVAALTFVAFLPVLGAGFVSWDDPLNFLENPHYRGLGLEQLAWMWTPNAIIPGHYIPVTWMTLGLDYTLWGMHPAGYHFLSLAIHCADAVLVYFLVRRLLLLAGTVSAVTRDERSTTIAAACGALFFAIHPLRVESVAWITERRDVVSLAFYLGSALLYLTAQRRAERFARWYGLSLAMFACALLSKATAVTLPAALAIVNAYPLRRVGGRAGWWSASARRVYAELAPFASLALVVGLTSVLTLPAADTPLAPAGKMAISAYALGFYVWKTILPTGLAPLYEMPVTLRPFAPAFLAYYLVALAFVAGGVVMWRKRPGIAACAAAFVVLTLPLLGVVQNAPQLAADRNTYQSSLALAVLFGAVVLWRANRTAWLAGAAAVLLAMSAATWRQSLVWHDSDALWSRVLETDSTSSYAYNNLASVWASRGRAADAQAYFARALAIRPAYASAHSNLGILLAQEGKSSEAISHYERALAAQPSFAEAHNNWGYELAARGDADGAIAHFEQALALKPDYAEADVNWGNVLFARQQVEAAIEHYRRAAAARPDQAGAHINWGVALARTGRMREAFGQFEAAVAIDPADADAQRYLAMARRALADQ